MLLQVANKSLIESVKTTFLTASAASAASTLTVKDIQGFGVGDYIIIGEIGEKGTEVIRLHASTAPSGTTITLASNLVNPHGVDTPVYRADYDKAQFYRATTLTGSKTQLGSDVAIDPSEFYTYYEDASNTTGYGFVRWYNSGDTTASSYSGGINYEHDGTYSSYDRRTLVRMTKKVRNLISENPNASSVTDEEIKDGINSKQEEIYQARHWTFAEAERSQSAVGDKISYTISSTLDTDRIQLATYNTQPIAILGNAKWKNIHWDTDSVSTDPTNANIFNGAIRFAPRPTGSYYKFIIDSEVIYASGATATTFTGCLRGQENSTAAIHLNDATVTERSVDATATAINDADNITATDTTITVDSTSGFIKLAATTTAINDADNITATDTIITVDSTNGFTRGDYYRFKIDSEIIYAQAKTSTAFTSCLRGQEGTTAATHNDNVIVTELNIVIMGQLKPVDLFLGSDRTLIPKPQVLEYGTAADIAYGKLQDKALGDRMVALFDKGFKKLESDFALKSYGSFGRVKMREEVMSDSSQISNPNLYPSNLVGS